MNLLLRQLGLGAGALSLCKAVQALVLVPDASSSGFSTVRGFRSPLAAFFNLAPDVIAHAMDDCVPGLLLTSRLGAQDDPQSSLGDHRAVN